MSKIDFNSENYSHRLLLAQAMRDYAREPGRTLAGTKDGDEPSLLTALADAGVAMSKSNLDRIAAAGHPDDRQRPYGNNARRVAQFLEEKGHFPPGQKPEDVFKLLPLFFGGFSPNGAALLRELGGTFRSYQFSEFAPDRVTSGEITIGAVTEWNYAPFHEIIGHDHMHENMLRCDGVVFTDEHKNIFMMGREYFRNHPRLYMFEGVDRPNGKEIGLVYGTLLTAGLHARRHLSPIALQRSAKPYYGEEIYKFTDLPEYVAHYLSMAMTPGPKNLPSGLTLAELDERQSVARKRRRDAENPD